MGDRPLDSNAVAEITGFTPRWVRQKAEGENHGD